MTFPFLTVNINNHENVTMRLQLNMSKNWTVDKHVTVSLMLLSCLESEGYRLIPFFYLLSCSSAYSSCSSFFLLMAHSLLFFFFSSRKKLKSHLVRTQSLNVLPLKSGVGQNIAIHTTLTAKNFFLAYFYPSGPFTCIFSKTSPNFFLCWLWLTPDPV